jgi:hypothetical protein
VVLLVVLSMAVAVVLVEWSFIQDLPSHHLHHILLLLVLVVLKKLLP